MLTKTQIDWLCYKYGKLNKYKWCHFQGRVKDDPFLQADSDECPLMHIDIAMVNHVDEKDKDAKSDVKGHIVLSTFGLRRYNDAGKNTTSINLEQLYGIDYRYSNKVFEVNCQGEKISIKITAENGKGVIDELLLPLIDETLRFNLLTGDWQCANIGQSEITIGWDEVVALVRDKGVTNTEVKLKKDEMPDWVTPAFIAGLLESEYINGTYRNEVSTVVNTPKDIAIKRSDSVKANMPKDVIIAKPSSVDQVPLPESAQTAQPVKMTKSAASSSANAKQSQSLIDVNNIDDENILLDIPGITKSNLPTFLSERRRRGGFAKGEDIVMALELPPHFADKIEKIVEFKEYTGPVGVDAIGPRSRVVDD